MLCANARLAGIPWPSSPTAAASCGRGRPRIGGIVYTESARKVAYFVETCERHRPTHRLPAGRLGFMVGAEAEQEGIIRAGAEMVESHGLRHGPQDRPHRESRQRRGLLRHGGQGFDPHFTFAWPTARIGVMEGDSAVQAVFGPELPPRAATSMR
jgi:3-methylcrotonyl-CoA carboxylase beta subunit